MGSLQSTECKEGDLAESPAQTDRRRMSVATKDPLEEDHMSADDDDEEEEENFSRDLRDGSGKEGDHDSSIEDTESEKATQPLTEYFVNVVSGGAVRLCPVFSVRITCITVHLCHSSCSLVNC